MMDTAVISVRSSPSIEHCSYFTFGPMGPESVETKTLQVSFSEIYLEQKLFTASPVPLLYSNRSLWTFAGTGRTVERQETKMRRW